jgi:RNA polymerase sigma-70 factor (ECF subfamily)
MKAPPDKTRLGPLGSDRPDRDSEIPPPPATVEDSPALPEEAVFLEGLRRGDASAGRQFVRDYYPGIYRYLLTLSERPELAADLTQETFLQAWRHLDQFQGRAPLRVWLYRIARREFVRGLRSRRSQTSLNELEEVAEPHDAAWTDAVELRMVLCYLPREEREAVLLHYLEGYNCREIARMVRAPVGTVKQRLMTARSHLQRELGEGDLLYLNEASMPMRQWRWLPLEAMSRIQARLSMESPGPRTARPASEEQDMERREFLRQAAVGAAGLMLPEAEKEIVDDRLTQKVTCAFKGTALSDLCEKLKSDTGVHLVAGPSVADEKVTLFCEKLPLREVMRQLSRPFGYTWLRSGTPGQYRYELVQDLRSQLLEEELRNRDRNQSLLALEKEIERYRPYLNLSPDEALERAGAAPAGEKELLEKLSGPRWGVLQMFVRLSPQDLALLRAGQDLYFCEAPQAGEAPLPPGQRVLPPEIGRGVLQSMRGWRLIKSRNDEGVEGYGYSPDRTAPGALPPADIPTCRAGVTLRLNQSELGYLRLGGLSHINSMGSNGQIYNDLQQYNGDCATGIGPTVLSPNNAALNAGLARDPALQRRVTVVTSGRGGDQRAVPAAGTPDPNETSAGAHASPKVISADVLEALHRATGQPIISDYYTRLYEPQTVTARDTPLFDALNRLADTMRMRWNKETDWLQFRTASFYDDRLKEVPNRLLSRWVASRRQHGVLSLDDLCEIAELRDAQLDAGEMAEGARDYLGLAEWDLARDGLLRPHLRFLASLMPSQRQEATTAAACSSPGCRCPSSSNSSLWVCAVARSNRSMSWPARRSGSAIPSPEPFSGARPTGPASTPAGSSPWDRGPRTRACCGRRSSSAPGRKRWQRSGASIPGSARRSCRQSAAPTRASTTISPPLTRSRSSRPSPTCGACTFRAPPMSVRSM